ncbi:MAG: hypothetical protein M1826_005636 [Phylliscum demangeonii]|nr:MAG: hypothetical protein M1826_005636 [Phylliscum demangeonii]
MPFLDACRRRSGGQAAVTFLAVVNPFLRFMQRVLHAAPARPAFLFSRSGTRPFTGEWMTRILEREWNRRVLGAPMNVLSWRHIAIAIDRRPRQDPAMEIHHLQASHSARTGNLVYANGVDLSHGLTDVLLHLYRELASIADRVAHLRGIRLLHRMPASAPSRSPSPVVLPPEFDRRRRPYQSSPPPPLAPSTERVSRPYGGSVPLGSARERVDRSTLPTTPVQSSPPPPAAAAISNTPPEEMWPLLPYAPPPHPDGAAPWASHGVLLEAVCIRLVAVGRWRLRVSALWLRLHPPPAVARPGPRAAAEVWLAAVGAVRGSTRSLRVLALTGPLVVVRTTSSAGAEYGAMGQGRAAI